MIVTGRHLTLLLLCKDEIPCSQRIKQSLLYPEIISFSFWRMVHSDLLEESILRAHHHESERRLPEFHLLHCVDTHTEIHMQYIAVLYDMHKLSYSRHEC